MEPQPVSRTAGALRLASASPRGLAEFRRLLDRLPAAAYMCDNEGLITYFNNHAVRVWGREPKLNDPEDRFCGSFKLYSADGQAINHNQCWMALALDSAASDVEPTAAKAPAAASWATASRRVRSSGSCWGSFMGTPLSSFYSRASLEL